MRTKAIHKQVIDVKELRGHNPVVQFEVAADAELVDIQWDTSDGNGIALYYQLYPIERPSVVGRPNQTWRFMVVGTGDEFPEEARHMHTAVRNGMAWHIFDFDGNNIPWAEA